MRKRENTLEIAKKIKLGKREQKARFLVDNNFQAVVNYFVQRIEKSGYTLEDKEPDNETLYQIVKNLPQTEFNRLVTEIELKEQPGNYTADVLEALNNMGGAKNLI